MNAVDTRLYSLAGDLGMLQGVLNSLASEGVTPAHIQKIRDDVTVRKAVAEALGIDPGTALGDNISLMRKYRLLVHALLDPPGKLPPGPYLTAAWDWLGMSRTAQKVVAHYLQEENFRMLFYRMTPLHRAVLLWVWTRDGAVTFESIAREFGLPPNRAERLYKAAHHWLCEEISALFYDELVLEKTRDAELSVPVELLDLSETTKTVVLTSCDNIRDLMLHNRASLRDAVGLSAEQVEEVCSRLERIDIHLN